MKSIPSQPLNFQWKCVYGYEDDTTEFNINIVCALGFIFLQAKLLTQPKPSTLAPVTKNSITAYI